ncbi:GTP cyclohydrolase II [Nocardia panacis]|uniref:GTP cyclohydrolase II n=1 Tax=Nocardia panacis TaxID=2340916 RepID=A0A3A4KJZ0_9NOCA|nr:GTP cyclohydrolase II [Nocardia panacis]RJO74110.1 GTP cyclohydrolase II [Nocardia panacis]
MRTTVSNLAGDTEHRITRAGGELRVRVLELDGYGESGHALIFGDPADGCLVRVHSRCLYGEALGSDDCDCGPELTKSLDLMQANGSGVLIYLEQEGRGLGLLAKARGYRHSQCRGTDTFASYEALGYPADARSYDAAARVLLALRLRAVDLLTNNPAKVAALTAAGLAVTAVPLYTRVRSERARDYLEAKRRRRGHWIPTDAAPWAADPEPATSTAPEQLSSLLAAPEAPLPV